MKKYLILAVCLIITIIINAQVNLVPNPSFEQYSQCPDEISEINRCLDWRNAGDSSATSTPDYFNTCSSVNGIAPPNVAWGYQMPHSGNAFANICTIVNCCPNGREFIQVPLTQTLNIGQEYFVSFYTSLSSAVGHTVAANKLGALFTTYPFQNPNYAHVINYAHVYTDSIISDTVNWIQIKGSFIADSAYTFVTIGNFFDDAHTDTIRLYGNSYLSDYYIDDVCVGDSSACFVVTGVFETNKINLIVFPNPANEFLMIRNTTEAIQEISIYDVSGINVYNDKKLNYQNEYIVNTKVFSQGIYTIKIFTKSQLITKFIIINHN